MVSIEHANFYYCSTDKYQQLWIGQELPTLDGIAYFKAICEPQLTHHSGYSVNVCK
jgi:hypothetical protein